MSKTTAIQGRKIAPEDIELIKKLIDTNPSWGAYTPLKRIMHTVELEKFRRQTKRYGLPQSSFKASKTKASHSACSKK